MNLNKKIFFWSPILSHVGTIKAVEKSAEALKKYSNLDIYLINVFGEFDYLQNNKNYKTLNIFKFRNWPQTGLISKIIIYLFTIISLYKLILFYKKYNPEILYCNLVGYLPNILKIIYPRVKIINSIQGLPKFNFLRRILWKIFYNKADYIFTMTELTKKKILENLNFKGHIFKVENPIINRNIRILSNKMIDENDKKYFNKITFIAVGRLTKQKNFINIINAVNLIPRNLHSKFNILIIGSGEEYNFLKNEIKKYNIENIFLLGFKKNPYPYLKKSNYYISSSLWEEPGHAILEAGYLNKMIISSDCPNGPKEILKDKENSIKFRMNDHENLKEIILKILENNIEKEFNIKLNMKKLVKKYSMYNFSKKINDIIN